VDEELTPMNIYFSEIAENDDLRSIYVHNNVFEKMRKIEYTTSESSIGIPRQIIQYWDSEFVPSDVQIIMETWNQCGLPRILFNKISAENYIKKYYGEIHVNAFNNCVHPAMRADFFRLCYLYHVGGFYIDADDKYNYRSIEPLFSNSRLKIQPLCYDIAKNEMVEVSCFFNESRNDNNYIYYVNNDPIVSPPKHPLIKLALNRATRSLINDLAIFKDIQSIAGPGNLTASLVQHSINLEKNNTDCDFEFILNWDIISTPIWDLEYRKDQRNWRNWVGEIM
jgi:mannosyltransferase OCH1-like enzyme